MAAVRDRFKIIANPVSGLGRGGPLARAVAERLRAEGCSVELLETHRPGDARRFAASVQDVSVVACIGGDGTVNEVLNGLPADTPPLAMIPSGTANVLAKELRLPRNVAGLTRVLRQGREIRWDLGMDRRSGRKFLLFASAGYDAHVVHIFHAARRGPIRMWHYILWGLKSILDYDPPRIRAEVDGRILASAAAWVLISNVASYGGPLVFTPHARPEDGAFEVMIQHGRRRRDVVRMFGAALLHYLLGVEIRIGGVTFQRAQRIRLESSDGRRVPVQMDGDPGGHLPADLELAEEGIRILGP